MSVINLDDYQIRLFKCEMTLHDYFWFASYDVSSLATTEAVIHNYALSYAVNRFDRGIMSNSGPLYEEDLDNMNFYALPARAIEYKKVSITYNALDTKTLKTDQYPKKNTPNLGKKILITPYSKFEFYLFSLSGKRPIGLIRIGKKRSLARIKWEEIMHPVVFYQDREFSVNHLVNPLDIQGNLSNYNIVRIPPFLLLKDAKIKNDWIIKYNNEIIHLPERIYCKLGETN